MDVHDKKTRSYNMSRIKSKNTKPEEIVRKYLFSNGFRYRNNVTSLPGKPDIVLPKYKAVIFVNGCFWHMHDCSHFVWPASNTEYWHNKICENAERDKKNIKLLEQLGWRVFVIWECHLKKTTLDATLSKLCTDIKREI